MLAEVYIDESEVLRKKNLPYFHMVDCAHGTSRFDHLDAADIEIVGRTTIRLTRTLSEFGFSVASNKQVFDACTPKVHTKNFGGQYTFCLLHALVMVSTWAREAKFLGRLEYIFEAGHASQSEADEIFKKIFKIQEIRDLFLYASHTFGEKLKYVPLQTADLLAWQYSSHGKRRLNDRPARKDFLALIRPGLDSEIIFDEPTLIAFMENISAKFPDDIYGEKIISRPQSF